MRHANVELHHLSAAARDSPVDLLVSTAPDAAPDRKEPASPAVMPVEGDTIGVAYDHVELNFFLNGKSMEIPVTNVKGTVYPALYGKGSLLILKKYIFIMNEKSFYMHQAFLARVPTILSLYLNNTFSYHQVTPCSFASL